MDFSAAALRRLGVTRIADLTGLDRLGVPVWCACRPDSRSLSVSHGKGLTHDAARTSAVMESLEYRAAERHEDLPLIAATEAELGPAVIASAGPPGQCRKWLTGASIMTGRAVHAPFEAIGMDMRIDAEWDATPAMSSVGLAAHATREAALEHALLEVIENDATQLVDAFGVQLRLIEPLRVDHAEGESLAFLLSAVAAADLRLHLFAITHPSGLPVVGARVSDAREGRLHGGYACRRTGEAAAEAAILEALQSRVTDIAGARDDIDPQDFAPRTVEPMPLPAGVRSAADLPAVTDGLSQCAVRAGAADVAVFDLARPETDGYAAVRVICPGLGHVRENGGETVLGSTALRMLLAGAGRP